MADGQDAMSIAQQALSAAREAVSRVESLGTVWETTFSAFKEHYSQRLDSGMVVIRENDQKAATAMNAMEGRLNTQISTVKIDLMQAVNDLKQMVTTMSATASNRMFSTGEKIVGGLIFVLYAMAQLYIQVGMHK